MTLQEKLNQALARIKEKDLIIDRLSQEKQAETSGYFYHQIINLKKLITELADALEEDEDFIEHQFEFSKDKIKNKFRPLLQRAREATGD